MLRAGMCSISVGIAVVTVALVVKSVGTYAPRDGSQAERLGVSVIQQWQLSNPAYRTAVSFQVPDDAGVRAAGLDVGLDKETVGVGSPAVERAIGEERYSFRERFASFDERFVGVARLIRRVAVKTENILPRYAMATETELPGLVTTSASSAGLATAAPFPAAAPATANASVNSSVRAPRVRQASLSSSSPDGQNRTAIYDISAQAVYLPNGRRLEAHSGLGSYMDDPRHVHIRRKGATPPNTYRLVERESLFHGVRAIRLIPVAGSNMFGRDGMLAHHYLLGPSGQSNGCVSIADYPAFLNAFLSGEIDRLVVVERLDKPPPGQIMAAGWIEKALKGFVKNFERGSGT